MAAALEPAWHPPPLDHSAAAPLDAAHVTLELACALPPRFEMVPNPLHEANMSRVARAWHQRRLRQKQAEMAKESWVAAPRPHLWSQDEFNPTREVFSTAARDAFEKSLCEDVARALGIPMRHVVIEEISGRRSTAAVAQGQGDAGGDVDAGDEVSNVASNTWRSPTDVEYSDDEGEAKEGDGDASTGSAATIGTAVKAAAGASDYAAHLEAHATAVRAAQDSGAVDDPRAAGNDGDDDESAASPSSQAGRAPEPVAAPPLRPAPLARNRGDAAERRDPLPLPGGRAARGGELGDPWAMGRNPR
jgi:hypothetical protein